MKASQRATNTHEPKQALAATVNDLEACLTATDHLALPCLMSWMTTGRLGCVLQLTKRNVQYWPDGRMSVSFRRGKRAMIKGPYTVDTSVPASWRERVFGFLASKKPDDFLWPAESLQARSQHQASINRMLREIRPRLQGRSLRRGSLQCLAAAGVPTETLLAFSGHTQLETLLRYLDFGAKPSERTHRAQDAARRHLGGGPQ